MKYSKAKTIFFYILICGIMMIPVMMLTSCRGTGETEKASEEAVGTCTISIRCDVLLDKLDEVTPEKAEFIPEDGVILQETEVSVKDGDTVYDILKNVCAADKIHMEMRNTAGTVYIEGIGQLYEFDCGELSGWMYSVNGIFPDYCCSEVEVSDGDVIEWQYTCNLGMDLGK